MSGGSEIAMLLAAEPEADGEPAPEVPQAACDAAPARVGDAVASALPLMPRPRGGPAEAAPAAMRMRQDGRDGRNNELLNPIGQRWAGLVPEHDRVAPILGAMAMPAQVGGAIFHVLPRDPRLVDSAAAAWARAVERRQREAAEVAAARAADPGAVARAADPGAAARAAVAGAKDKSTTGLPEPVAPIMFAAHKMDGTEVILEMMPTAFMEVARDQIATELGVDSGRVKLCFNREILENHVTIRAAGIEDGSDLTIVILPPIYGNFLRRRLDVPDSIIANKLELHEDLSRKMLERMQVVR